MVSQLQTPSSTIMPSLMHPTPKDSFALTQWIGKVAAQSEGISLQANLHQIGLDFLSRFGIKSPIQVLEFLNSPEGKRFNAEIQKAIAEEAYFFELGQIQYFESEQLRKFLRLIHFLLEHLRHHHALERQHQATVQENNQLTKKTTTTAPPAPHIDPNLLYPSTPHIDPYQHKIDALKGEQTKANAKYDKLDHTLETIFADEHLKGEGKKVEENILNQIKECETQNDKLADKINELSKEGKFEEAKSLMAECERLALQHATLSEMLATKNLTAENQTQVKEKKILLDAQGNQVDSYEKATYVVREGESIQRTSDGQSYLVNKDQVLAHLSDEQKQAALITDQVKAKIQATHCLIKEHRQLTNQHYQQEINIAYQQQKAQEEKQYQTKSPIPSTSSPSFKTSYNPASENLVPEKSAPGAGDGTAPSAGPSMGSIPSPGPASASRPLPGNNLGSPLTAPNPGPNIAPSVNPKGIVMPGVTTSSAINSTSPFKTPPPELSAESPNSPSLE